MSRRGGRSSGPAAKVPGGTELRSVSVRPEMEGGEGRRERLAGTELRAPGWLGLVLLYIYKTIYYSTMQATRNRRVLDALALVFVLAVAVGGWFFPVAGLALAGLMAVAVALSLLGRFGAARKRAFCNGVCPRGRALGFALKPISRGKALPRSFSDLSLRRGLCGFMMFCVMGSLVRALPGLEGYPALAAAGRIFWGLCVISLAGGLALGLLYRPRAWCVVCPMGTLQDTISGTGVRRASDDGTGEPARR